MNSGGEGFDYAAIVNLDHTNVLNLIRAVLPNNNNNNNNEVNMHETNACRQSRARPPSPTVNDRNQRRHIGQGRGSGGARTISSVNCDGLPDTADSLKTEELVSKICKHHLILLTETRTSNLDRVLQSLPQHVLIGKTVVPDDRNSRKG
eukprot:1144577-Pelagomonas_calceolata.AAC.7